MKKIINAFSVPILESRLDNVRNDILVNLINGLFASMPDKRLLSHEWNSRVLTDNPAATGYSSFDHGSLTSDSNFFSFFQQISPAVTDFFLQLGFNKSWNFANSWANVYPQDSFVPAHNHGTAHWSGVYYAKAYDNCGDLILTDPKEYALSNEPEHTKWRGRNDMRMHVESGTLIIFPGYLKHQTMPNLSNHNRKVISFNIQCYE